MMQRGRDAWFAWDDKGEMRLIFGRKEAWQESIEVIFWSADYDFRIATNYLEFKINNYKKVYQDPRNHSRG
jgi:hypothetical protein